MIDLSITQNSEWIKQREAVWKELEEGFKEGLRKKELQHLKNYFFTGVYEGTDFPDLAYIKWFPLQTSEALDYVLEHLVNKSDVFEKAFYSFMGDLTGNGFTEKQELALWDYFVGDIFKPTVTSRVPVGREKKVVSFDVDFGKIAAKFSLGIKGWMDGNYENTPKWIIKSDYFFSFLNALPEEVFYRDEDDVFCTRAAKVIESVFEVIAERKSGFNDDEKSFIYKFNAELNEMRNSALIKKLWEEIKAEHAI